MDIQPLLFFILALLFILDLMAAAARYALFNASLVRLLAVRDEQETRVKRVVDLLQSPRVLRAVLNLTQLFTRFSSAGLILAWLLTAEQTTWSILLGAVILVLTALIVFWIEWALDSFIARKAETWALRLAPFVRLLLAVFSPFLIIPKALDRRNKDAQEPAGIVTEDELKSMVDAGHEGGVLEQEERQMIYSIFDLGDTLAREIMVPRIYVTALDISVPLTEAIGTLVQSGHSRVPVYEDSIDKIKGLLYAKDLLRVWRDGGEIASVRSLLRPAYLVPEAKKVKDMLAEMQAGRVHMAIVVDEYGGVAGLVTMEDIVEEIVGEIRDEYDQSEELPFVQVGDGEYLFQGRIDLERVNEMMSSHLPTDESETLGGYIYGQVGRVPVNGEILRVDNLLLTVEQVSGHRIRKVRAKKVSSDQEVIQDDDKTDQ